jgi:hypothetical protein
LDPQFNSWKFWLSSAAFFAGLLIVGLIPGCAKGAEPQHQYQSSRTAHVEFMRSHLTETER